MGTMKIGQTISLHVKENISLYLFTIVLFTMGVCFGAVIVNSLEQQQKHDLMNYLGQFFSEFKQGMNIDPQTAFQQSFGQYIKYVGFMWILGLSIIGLPIILVMVFLKGLVVGFTVGFMINQWHWNGLLLAGATVLPQNLLVIPAVIMIGTAGVAFSLRLIRSRFIRRGEAISPYFFRYTALVVFVVILLCGASILEAILSPLLMKPFAASLLS